MKPSLIYLQKQFSHYQSRPINGIYIGLDGDNIYRWAVTIYGPQNSPLEGGLLRGIMSFPDDFPHSPPEFKFLTPMYHPNVYPDGKMCISILHSASDTQDIELSGEHPDERWSPAHSIESVLISIVNVLVEPNPNSPANVDAAVLFRDNFKKYKSRQRRIAEDSLDCC
ncbi:hypothetical protein P9112_006370 [Eukaryota sp. TZLM1-RC]